MPPGKQSKLSKFFVGLEEKLEEKEKESAPKRRKIDEDKHKEARLEEGLPYVPNARAEEAAAALAKSKNAYFAEAAAAAETRARAEELEVYIAEYTATVVATALADETAAATSTAGLTAILATLHSEDEIQTIEASSSDDADGITGPHAASSIEDDFASETGSTDVHRQTWCNLHTAGDYARSEERIAAAEQGCNGPTMMVVHHGAMREMCTAQAYFEHFVICMAVMVNRANQVTSVHRTTYVDIISQAQEDFQVLQNIYDVNAATDTLVLVPTWPNCTACNPLSKYV